MNAPPVYAIRLCKTACITYWDVPHPGRLGSLPATDTDRNGGWFFYKWYGEMTGNMVSATSSLAVNGKNLDGAASLDTSAGNAFVILGGVNDGSIRIVVKGLKAAPFLGNSVRAVVERTPWASISTVATQTMTVSTTPKFYFANVRYAQSAQRVEWSSTDLSGRDSPSTTSSPVARYRWC